MNIQIMLKKLKYIILKLLSLLYPYKCPVCKDIIYEELFCQSCWNKLQFINSPCCSVCGDQLDLNKDYNIICGNCLKKKYYFDKHSSVFIYNKTISKAIFEFKFYRKTFLSKFFVRFLIKKYKTIGYKIDYITAVPLHIKRLRWRGYNQSVLLVKELEKEVSAACIYDLLEKIKHTKPQSQFMFKDRKKNLKSVFEVKDKYINLIRGKNILIVDDVFTTGSTINECARTLKKYGAKKVFALTIAKTSRMRNDKL